MDTLPPGFLYEEKGEGKPHYYHVVLEARSLNNDGSIADLIKLATIEADGYDDPNRKFCYTISSSKLDAPSIKEKIRDGTFSHLSRDELDRFFDRYAHIFEKMEPYFSVGIKDIMEQSADLGKVVEATIEVSK